METVQKEYLSPNTIAAMLDGVSPITVRRWCREGRIKHRKLGRSIQVLKKDWEQFDKSNTIA